MAWLHVVCIRRFMDELEPHMQLQFAACWLVITGSPLGPNVGTVAACSKQVQTLLNCTIDSHVASRPVVAYQVLRGGMSSLEQGALSRELLPLGCPVLDWGPAAAQARRWHQPQLNKNTPVLQNLPRLHSQCLLESRCTWPCLRPMLQVNMQHS